MKKNKFTILIFFGLLFFLSSCESAREGLTGKRKNNTDEFLVQKKNPLVVPPDYNDLPLPKDQKIQKEQSSTNIDNEIKKLMDSEENDNVSNSNSVGENSVEDSIIKKLKKN